MTPAIPALLYLVLSAFCIAAVLSWLVIRACNAFVRPDELLAAIMRAAYYAIYAAQSAQIGLAHFRHAKEINQEKLKAAMQPVRIAQEWEG